MTDNVTEPRKSTLTTRTMLQLDSAMRCLSCETPLRLTEVWPGHWQCHCPNCYDDTPDAPAVQHVTGFGATPEASLWAWTEAWELATDIAVFPVNVVLDLQKQVAAESAPQRDWQRSDAPDGAIHYGPAQRS